MPKIRCDLHHRLQYEIPVFHINMRHMQFHCINDLIIVKQNIQIQCPWSPVNDPFSVRSLFQHMQPVKKLLRRKQRPDS